MNKSGARLDSEKGQGLVEYILLLVVVVTIALTFMNLFFKPYAKWASQHIGAYVECLLDQGELPALGGVDGIKNCDLDTSDFTGGSGSKRNASNKSGDDVSRDGRDKDGSRDHSTTGPGATVLGSARDSGSKLRRLGAMDGSAGSSPKSSTVGVDPNSVNAGNMRFSGAGRQYRSEFPKRGSGGSYLSGLLEAEREKIKKRAAKTQKVSSGEGGEATTQAKKFAVEQKQRKVADVDLSGEGWSFGKLFRLLLIIVIIIALVLFIGGQVMSITKGMEK